MATEVRLPQFGMGMQEGKMLRWFKHEGETVEEGEPLCEVETEKATVEVPTPQSGRLARILVEVERTVPVLEVLAIIESPSELRSWAPPKERAVNGAAAVGEAPQPPAAVHARPSAATVANVQVTPLARRVAKEHGIDLREVRGTGPGGRITDQDVRRFIASSSQPASFSGDAPRSAAGAARTQPGVQVEPRARRLAQQYQIDLRAVTGSGPSARITEEDVRRAISRPKGVEQIPPPIPSAVSEDGGKIDEGSERTIPLTGMRGVIARRMLESLQTSAQLTLASEADVTALVQQRELLSRQFEITYTDLLIKAAALALRKHPRLNAAVVDQQIHLLPEIHIGVAVALEDGLVVPVVRNADRKPLGTIAREAAGLIKRARGGKLMMAEISGGTFTVTNLGGFGIDMFTPILNPPEAAILGVGRIAERLVRRDADLIWRQMMVLSLTIDHRVVDGAPAAAFLQTLRQLLEQPEALTE